MLTVTLRDASSSTAANSAATLPIEVDDLLPEKLRALTLAEIERLPVWQGNRQVPLAELFHVRGSAEDETLELVGDLKGVHHIGTRQTSGVIRVVGSAGRHLGAAMRGGTLTVEGDVSDWLGAEMAGGTIDVRGGAGQCVGGAYRGSAKGMTGGTILVAGDVADECGTRMRRGLIAVGGSCGQLVGAYMLAGTICVFGECGARAGAGMRRGTLALFGANPPRLLPTFRSNGPATPVFMRLYLRHLQQLGFALPGTLDELSCFDSYQGDALTIGRGEILCARR